MGAFFRGSLVGCASFKGPKNGSVMVSQMAVTQSYRENGFGRSLLNGIELEGRSAGAQDACLHARCYAVNFYKSCGYRVCSSEFIEVGIPHVLMSKQL